AQVSEFLRAHRSGSVALFAADRDDQEGRCNRGQGAPRIRRAVHLLQEGHDKFAVFRSIADSDLLVAADPSLTNRIADADEKLVKKMVKSSTKWLHRHSLHGAFLVSDESTDVLKFLGLISVRTSVVCSAVKRCWMRDLSDMTALSPHRYCDLLLFVSHAYTRQMPCTLPTPYRMTLQDMELLRDVSDVTVGKTMIGISFNLAVVRSELQPASCTCLRDRWLDYSRRCPIPEVDGTEGQQDVLQVSEYLSVHRNGAVALFAADKDDLEGRCNRGEGAPRIRRVDQLLHKD
ncbi:unnamed protein product, partial [Ixodes hexagonus]